VAKSADAFRTISEVAEWLETPAHVLRFWESRFTQVKPVKRAGGRRYYRPNDMLLLGGIKKLLHEDGMTIKGVQKLLRTDGIKKISTLSQPIDGEGGVVVDMIAQVPQSDETPPAPDAAIADASAEIQIESTANEPQPELEPQAELEPEIAPEPAPAADLEPQTQAAQAPQPTPEPQIEAQIGPVQKPEPVLAPEIMFEPESELQVETTLKPEPAPYTAPIAELEPAPAPEIIPEPVPEFPTQPITTASDTTITPETAQPPAEMTSAPDAALKNDDKSQQIASIYVRLTALHTRMKANIDPKRQG